MKGKPERKRGSLSLFYFAIVFCSQLLAVLAASALTYLLAWLGALTPFGIARESSIVLLFVVVLSAVVCVAITWLTKRIILKPFHRLIRNMDRLARGDFRVRLEFGRPASRIPALAEVADSFNIMARELGNTEMLREDFINHFSHEFKTPIVSIAGFAKLLRRGNVTAAQEAEYLTIIEEESLRLATMATNVLELTKLENQAILSDVAAYNVSEQIRACVLLLEDRWTRKQLDLDLEFREHTICANEELMKHVWINLLDNAIKFSPPTGEIVVRMEERGQALRVSITNFGAEIPPEQQERIFGKFYQTDASHASAGNGLGLAIVKRVVELHRGTVTAASRDGATTFTVELPREAAP